MLTEEVLLAVRNEHGVNVLDSVKRLITLINDYSNNSLSDNVEFLDFKACYSNGLSAFAKDIYNESDIENLAVLSQKAKKHLVNNKRLSETSVISGINILLKALGKKYQLPQVPMENIKDCKRNTDDMDQLKCSVNRNEECLFNHDASVSTKKWFLTRLEAALSGNIEAMMDMADCYRKGNIVQKNWRLAVKWYEDIIKTDEDTTNKKLIEAAKEKLVEFYNELDDNYYR